MDTFSLTELYSINSEIRKKSKKMKKRNGGKSEKDLVNILNNLKEAGQDFLFSSIMYSWHYYYFFFEIEVIYTSTLWYLGGEKGYKISYHIFDKCRTWKLSSLTSWRYPRAHIGRFNNGYCWRCTWNIKHFLLDPSLPHLFKSNENNDNSCFLSKSLSNVHSFSICFLTIQLPKDCNMCNVAMTLVECNPFQHNTIRREIPGNIIL